MATIVIETDKDFLEFFRPVIEKIVEELRDDERQRHLNDEILTKRQVKEILKIKDSTFYSYLREGKLKGFKLSNGEWRIKYKDLKELIK